MSLINDYLKKTQEEVPVRDQRVDIPPILKTGKPGKRVSLALPLLLVFCVLGGIAFFTYFKFQSSFQQSVPPPALLARASAVQAPVVEPAPKTAPEEIKLISAPPSEPAAAKKIETPKEAPAVPAVKEIPEETPIPEKKPAQTIHQAPPPVKVTPVEVGKKKPSQADLSHYYQLALLAQQEGDYRGAERYYQWVLADAPNHIEALTNLSALFIQQSKFTEAKEALRKIIRLAPGNTKALVNLGTIDLKLNQYKSAETQFKAALRINPREEAALVNLAFLAKQEDNPLLMEEYYKKILIIAPDNSEVLLAYASFLEKNNRLAEAREHYQQSLEVDAVKVNERLFYQIKDRINVLNYYIREG